MPSMTNPCSGCVLLCADDAAWLRKLLAGGGWTLQHQRDLKRVVTMACSCDVLIVDLPHATEDLIDWCRDLRACAGWETVPVLIVTQSPQHDFTPHPNLRGVECIARAQALRLLRVRVQAAFDYATLWQQATQAQRLAHRLTQAGQICHDMNQPLQAIAGFTQLLSMQTTPDAPHYEMLFKIASQVERLSDFSHQLMHLARGDALMPQAPTPPSVATPDTP